ncbi:hypothetical protein [Wukongibacter sp. M2B1]|uniref:hypothetical protein n=1 Tax=Wukongibacter sp. M2B1 TaxID=3088895 RepID=UPI003D7BA646
MKRARKNQLLAVAIICFLFTLVIYYYNYIKIPRIQGQVETVIRNEIDLNFMEKRHVAVVKGEEVIPKYTVLTDEIIEKSIEIKEIPITFAIGDGVGDIDLIKGKITQEALRPGQQIAYDSISTEKKWFGDYDRLTEFTFKDIVAGEVREGNIIDVLVNYDNGDYDVIIPKIKVRRLIENKASDNDEADTLSHTLVMSLDEEQQRDAELASKLGYFEARLYLDESQKASLKTFSYDDARKKLDLEDVSEKGLPSNDLINEQKEKVEKKEEDIVLGN